MSGTGDDFLSPSPYVDSDTPPCVHSKCPCVYQHHVHVCSNMCAWCQYTQGRFERTQGDVLNPHTHTRQDTQRLEPRSAQLYRALTKPHSWEFACDIMKFLVSFRSREHPQISASNHRAVNRKEHPRRSGVDMERHCEFPSSDQHTRMSQVYRAFSWCAASSLRQHRTSVNYHPRGNNYRFDE